MSMTKDGDRKEENQEGQVFMRLMHPEQSLDELVLKTRVHRIRVWQDEPRKMWQSVSVEIHCIISERQG